MGGEWAGRWGILAVGDKEVMIGVLERWGELCKRCGVRGREGRAVKYVIEEGVSQESGGGNKKKERRRQGAFRRVNKRGL